MTPTEQAASFLPKRLRSVLLDQKLEPEEIHLRAGRPMTICEGDGKERRVKLCNQPILVSEEELRTVVELATCASYHTAMERLCQGFLPLKGGHRLGLSGTVTVQGGKIAGISSFSSLCIRVARPVKGIGRELLNEIFSSDGPKAALILSPPGLGKTTLLRELLRCGGERGIRIGLADERGEVAALWNGVPQMDVGPLTDVMDGCPKAEGLMLLLRSMAPQLLAADEITASEDIAALSMAANCGVPVLATAHTGSVAELRHRPLYRQLLQEEIFSQVILIRRTGSQRTYHREELRSC